VIALAAVLDWGRAAADIATTNIAVMAMAIILPRRI
jgi:hypothetical protein